MVTRALGLAPAELAALLPRASQPGDVAGSVADDDGEVVQAKWGESLGLVVSRAATRVSVELLS